MATISGLFTDYYELTMAQGYFLHHRNTHAVFEMFFRRQPFGGGYAVFAGLDDLLLAVVSMSFQAKEIDFLRSKGSFTDEFLSYLASFRFSGDLFSVDEGTVIFPREPLIRVHGNLPECQLIESLLLNCINFLSF